jgi:hypothetical protein
MKKLLPALFLASAMSAPVLAGEVDAAAVNTFEAGTPAVAAEVNDNFAALISAINDNATRITALEDAVPDSITGTWSVVGLEMEMAGNTGENSYSELILLGSSGSFEFNASGTFNGTINDNQVKLSELRSELEGISSLEPSTSTPTETLSGTWTENARNVTVTLTNGESVTLLKGSDNLLILGESELFSSEPIGGSASLIFLVRD